MMRSERIDLLRPDGRWKEIISVTRGYKGYGKKKCFEYGFGTQKTTESTCVSRISCRSIHLITVNSESDVLLSENS
jgi:hypothetical protein